MAGYQYEALGDEDFQRLVHALLAHSLGRHLRAMPLGKADGGRDAVHNAVVFQVKFTGSPDAIDDRAKWLLKALDAESEKIKRLAARGCKEYILVTNVGGTGNLDRGTIDRLDADLKTRQAQWGIKRVMIWWRNEVDAQFFNAPISTKLAFLKALPTDEALAITLLDVSSAAKQIDRALAAYVADQYNADNRVRFEQADLAGPTVEKLFVDVAVGSGTAGSEAESLLLRLGQHEVEAEDDVEGPLVGGAKLLLHPQWQGNALIVGGPGQGKTTLLQYICQAHRSRQLRRETYQGDFPQQHLKAICRIPFRIDLRQYATWSGAKVSIKQGGKRERKERVTHALEAFLADHVTRNCGGMDFTVKDLVSVVADRPVLLALDGLDEVADQRERERVAEEISGAARRLQQNAANILILVTTRPGATNTGVLLADQFPVLIMQRLTSHLRLGYLGKWAQQAGLLPDQVDELRRTFIDKQSLPHVRELSSNPMQLAILLHLMQRRGILPEQRTELYTDYVKVFLDREAPKDPAVRAHRPLIEDVHAYLAWHLQSEAERGQSNGALTPEQLRRLLDTFLRDHGDRGQLVQQLFEAITGRVICLVQRPAGIEFEVQPLREYFAARYLHDGAPLKGERNTKDDRLDALLRRTYWSNVLRFFAGMLSRGEVRGLSSNLRGVRANKPFDVLPLSRALAVQLLDDQVYIRQGTISIQDAVDAALDGPGAVFASDRLLSTTGDTLRLAEGAGRSEIVVHVQRRLVTETDPAIRRLLGQLLLDHGEPGQLRSWWRRETSIEAGRWVPTAADLQALNSVDSATIAKLLDYGVDGSTQEPELLTELLLRAKSDCTDERVMARCIIELGDGLASDMPPTASEELISRLHRWSHPVQFFAHRAGSPVPGKPVGAAAGAHRRDRTSSPSNKLRALISTLSAQHNAGADWKNVHTWLEAMTAVHDIYGDSWLVREAVFAMPGRMVAQWDDSSDADRTILSTLISRLRQARENSGDPAWWRAEHPAEDHTLARRTWLFALLLHAKAVSVYECADLIDATLAQLRPSHLAILLAAIDRQRNAGHVRQLDLHERLRTGRFAPAAITATVLYQLSFESTQPGLARIVIPSLPALMESGARVAEAAIDICGAHGTRAVAIETFRGGRRILSQRALERKIKLAKPAVGRSREILSQPEQWPPEIVRLAVERASAALTELRPLADVADRDGWFG